MATQNVKVADSVSVERAQSHQGCQITAFL